MEISLNCSFSVGADDKDRAPTYACLMFLTILAMTSLQAQAQELFANQSANPPAAQFRNVRTVGDVVCGEVNKTNRQGGFDGYVRFVYRDSQNWAIELGPYYRFAENGRQMGTEFMYDAARREEKWNLARAAELLREAQDATERVELLFERCN